MYDTLVLAPEHTVRCADREQLVATLETDNRFMYEISDIKSTRDLNLSEHGEITLGNTPVSMTKNAFSSYCKFLSIPDVFARKIPGDLLSRNVNRLSGEFEKPIKLITRLSDRAIVNVVKDNFVSFGNNTLVSNIRNAFIGSGKDGRYAEISDTGMRMYLGYADDYAVEPKVGDIVKIGKELYNSETGFGNPYGRLMAYRLICSNGATLPMCFGEVKKSNNSKISYEVMYNMFLTDLENILPDMELLKKSFDIMEHEAVYDDDMVNIVTNVSSIITSTSLGNFLNVNTDDEFVKSYAEENLKVEHFEDYKKEVQKRKLFIKNHPFADPPARDRVFGMNYFDLYNNITALPHNFRSDFKRTQKIEGLGGSVVQHVLNEFSTN